MKSPSIAYGFFIILGSYLHAFSASAANTHVHGQGEMLISQEHNRWQILLTLPAADMLGFEHMPETEAQRQKLERVAKQLENNRQLLELNGQCSVVKAEHNLKNVKHGGHGHHDISISYTLDCESRVTQIQVLFFEWVATDLVKAQWVLEQGQGTQHVTPANPNINW
ncbi:MAG: DUF2796 domain-containing protein [Idiomarina sp.]